MGRFAAPFNAAAVSAALICLVAAAAGGAASPAPAASPQPGAPPPGPPLTMENAKPLTPPPAPRLTAPPPPPAPIPLKTPEMMFVPETPTIASPAPVAVPLNPQGAPVPAKPVPTGGAYVAPSVPAEERVVTAPTKPPPPPMQPLAPSAPKNHSTAPPVSPPAAAPEDPPPVAAHAGSLDFAAGSATLPPESETVLTALAADMRAAPTRRLQLRAYAAGDVDSERQARQLSLARALAVRERLTALGVRSTRIDLRPIGIVAPPTEPQRRDRVDLEYVSE